MKILITGAKGFIGKNLIQELKKRAEVQIYEYDISSPKEDLEEFCSACDFVYHLAGVNRPKDSTEFISGNMLFTLNLIDLLKKYNNLCPVVFSSSIQAVLDNPYGISKKACEDFLFFYGKETGAKVYVYRFPNIFGKWSRPNYNSVVATFCYNLTHGHPIQVNDPGVVLKLVYIDDLVKELVSALDGEGHKGEEDYYMIPEEYSITLGEIVEILYSFQKITVSEAGNIKNDFIKKLYTTYKSYEDYEL